MAFLLEPENTAQWAIDSGYVPVTESGVNTEEYQTYLEENPHIIKELTAPNIISDTVINNPSGKGMDGGMKEVFSRVAEGHPNSPLADRFGDNRSITKKKVESLGRKHGLIKDGSQVVPELSNTYKTT